MNSQKCYVIFHSHQSFGRHRWRVLVQFGCEGSEKCPPVISHVPNRFSRCECPQTKPREKNHALLVLWNELVATRFRERGIWIIFHDAEINSNTNIFRRKMFDWDSVTHFSISFRCNVMLPAVPWMLPHCRLPESRLHDFSYSTHFFTVGVPNGRQGIDWLGIVGHKIKSVTDSDRKSHSLSCLRIIQSNQSTFSRFLLAFIPLSISIVDRPRSIITIFTSATTFETIPVR